MKFTIDRRALLDVARRCSVAAASKGVHPIYESVLIQASATGAMRYAASDLEIGVEIGGEAAVQLAGSAVTPARDLAAILGKLPDGDVVVESDDDAHRVQIKLGRSAHKLPTQHVADFPTLPEPGRDARWIAVNASEFATSIRRVAQSCAKERMRYALNGALFEVKGGALRLVATDGRRLSFATAAAPADVEVTAIVSRNGLDEIVKLCEGAEAVELCASAHHFHARVGGSRVVSRLLEGSFPNYKDVVPADGKTRATMNRVELIGALERVGMVEGGDRGVARFELDGGALRVLARTPEREADETIDCEIDGPPQTIGLDSDLLKPLVAALDGERVTLHVVNKTAPVKLVEPAQTHVLMPISLD